MLRNPMKLYATFFIEEKGLIKINAPAFLTLDKYVAGPDPIDLPTIIIYYFGILKC